MLVSLDESVAKMLERIVVPWLTDSTQDLEAGHDFVEDPRTKSRAVRPLHEIDLKEPIQIRLRRQRVEHSRGRAIAFGLDAETGCIEVGQQAARFV